MFFLISLIFAVNAPPQKKIRLYHAQLQMGFYDHTKIQKKTNDRIPRKRAYVPKNGRADHSL